MNTKQAEETLLKICEILKDNSREINKNKITEEMKINREEWDNIITKIHQILITTTLK